MTRELAKAGLVDTGHRNVTGRTLGEIAADARETPGQEVDPAGRGPAVADRRAWRSCAATSRPRARS